MTQRWRLDSSEADKSALVTCWKRAIERAGVSGSMVQTLSVEGPFVHDTPFVLQLENPPKF